MKERKSSDRNLTAHIETLLVVAKVYAALRKFQPKVPALSERFGSLPHTYHREYEHKDQTQASSQRISDPHQTTESRCCSEISSIRVLASQPSQSASALTR